MVGSPLWMLLASAPAFLFIRWRRRNTSNLDGNRHAETSEEEQEEEWKSVSEFRHLEVPLDAMNSFSHQVAGHTKEILRTFRGCILKPMIKVRHFFRELRIYEKMESQGTHWTQSAKSFVSNYHGLIVAKKDPTTTAPPPSSSSSVIGKNGTHRLYLALNDLTKDYKSPCAIDIKMGTQTYEPGASEEKKQRELVKCKYQAEVGFRITGFKTYDSLNGTYAGVSNDKVCLPRTRTTTHSRLSLHLSIEHPFNWA